MPVFARISSKNMKEAHTEKPPFDVDFLLNPMGQIYDTVKRISTPDLKYYNMSLIKPKVKPKADRKDGLLSKSGNPTQGPGNRGMREKKITTTTLPKTSTAKPKPSVEALVKPSAPTQPSGGGNGKAKPTTNSAKLDAWKAGDKSLSSKEQFRLAKWAERNDLSVPRDLAKDRVRLSLKTSKNKGGPVTKKPKGAYAAGGLKATSANQAGLKKLPKSVRNKMGYMSKGGMTTKRKR